MQVFHGLRRNIECFCSDCRSWAKVIGVELQGPMLYQGHLLKWLAMLRNISSGRAMCPGGKDGPACLILLQMKFVPLFANYIKMHTMKLLLLNLFLTLWPLIRLSKICFFEDIVWLVLASVINKLVNLVHHLLVRYIGGPPSVIYDNCPFPFFCSGFDNFFLSWLAFCALIIFV